MTKWSLAANLRRWALYASVCLVLAANAGCHMIHPPKPPEPLDPLPDVCHMEPTGELPVEVQDRMKEMEVRIGDLTRQMSQLQSEVAARQHDLMNTRRQYEDALHEIQLMREEISFWGMSMQKFQERLSERDEERLEMLDELSAQLGELVAQ